jgi:hypothetical protein
MMVLESRKYGFSRAVGQELAKVQPRGGWLHVNDVAGFIGPEVFKSPEQLVRCCLEDIVMAKLHGLTIGLDICSTLHMADPRPGSCRIRHAGLRFTSSPAQKTIDAYLTRRSGPRAAEEIVQTTTRWGFMGDWDRRRRTKYRNQLHPVGSTINTGWPKRHASEGGSYGKVSDSDPGRSKGVISDITAEIGI